MSHHWVIEVLNDLRAYAQLNDLPVLADHLSDALKVAADEIAVAAKPSLAGEPAYDLSGHV